MEVFELLKRFIDPFGMAAKYRKMQSRDQVIAKALVLACFLGAMCIVMLSGILPDEATILREHPELNQHLIGWPFR